MPALFSDHTFRHYAYLRDSLSHLVPPLRLPGKKMASSSGLASLTLPEDPSQEFLQQSLERVFSLQHLDPQGSQELLEFTIRYWLWETREGGVGRLASPSLVASTQFSA
ncbi:hypothetical protein Chor_010433 [Crotalus horridus]